MEITAEVEMISKKQTRSFPTKDGQTQTIDYVEMVLNNGIERFACETANGNLAKVITEGEAADRISKGDSVHAILINWASPQKTNDGREFMVNRIKVHQIKKIPDFREAPVF